MQNKVRVTKLLGAGSDQGLMDPRASMRVKNGQDTRWVKTFSPSGGLCDLVMASGGTTVVGQAYAESLLITEADAAQFGWPSGSDCFVYGHKKYGHPVGVNSGVTYLDGAGIHTFGR